MKPTEYLNEFKITTFDDLEPLIRFYNQFIGKNSDIYLGKIIKNTDNSQEKKRNALVPAKIVVCRTEKGLMALIKVKFRTENQPATEWVKYIHEQFPTLKIYLKYQDAENTIMGKMHTEEEYPKTEKEKVVGKSKDKLIHNEREFAWHDLDETELFIKLENEYNDRIINTKNKK